MSTVDNNPYRTWGLTAADAPATERATFIRRTYLHLLIAVLAFIGLETALLNSSLAEPMTQFALGNGRIGWLVVIAAFVGVSWLANSWASSATSVGMQYLGLALYVVAQAFIFVPLLFMARLYDPSLIMTAAVLTGIIFCGLTAIVFLTGADFSFMRTGLSIAGFGAIAVIACSAFMGFNLGVFFIGAMIIFASAYILYDTSNVLHHYRIGQHVAASLALFASVALLFWYIVQLLMSLSSRD
ncbi:MAG: Bax inhibitor-1 family protein [Pirellulales bacterium]|nr:Bax inhibitor-1 family protein [Pirellulales bacterium]